MFPHSSSLGHCLFGLITINVQSNNQQMLIDASHDTPPPAPPPAQPQADTHLVSPRVRTEYSHWTQRVHTLCSTQHPLSCTYRPLIAFARLDQRSTQHMTVIAHGDTTPVQEQGPCRARFE